MRWSRTTPYGDNEKEASLGGTASVCPRVVCARVCVCVSAGEPGALWHLLIKSSQAAGQGRQMPVMTHTTYGHTHAQSVPSTTCTITNTWTGCAGQPFLESVTSRPLRYHTGRKCALDRHHQNWQIGSVNEASMVKITLAHECFVAWLECVPPSWKNPGFILSALPEVKTNLAN